MRFWTIAEESLIKERYPDTPMSELRGILARSERSIYAKARELGVSRSEEFKAGEHGGRMRKGISKGVATQFKKGHNRYASKVAQDSNPGPVAVHAHASAVVVQSSGVFLVTDGNTVAAPLQISSHSS